MDHLLLQCVETKMWELLFTFLGGLLVNQVLVWEIFLSWKDSLFEKVEKV